ncbi:hypothetical protein PRK78_002442 [Emydomyces testavorans]|uniref:RRM domain-containing protein n=1 Tax=Emydomyces testavorans TaxID=2070801 RepID=A0AAF0IHK7_9EURO|nr:hypothetical protein PRK78_002442 [Emydomyces testavorans]
MAHRPASKPTTAGILPIPASATQQHTALRPRSTNSRIAAPRTKLLIRRLPPGLTQLEFETALGEEWAVGKGKVDWLTYKPGKVSADLAKPSRPSRAYIRITSSAVLNDLAEKVRQTSFQDARNSSADPALLGPPTLEYAPYPRVPGGKVRKDARLGTIDQDPEFIAFLESLTNPVSKPNPEDVVEANKEEKRTITPLIQFLKEKKANRAKEASAPPKPAKPSRSGPKDLKPEKVQTKKVLSRTEKAASSAPPEKQAKSERAAKVAVKAANKQIAAQAPKQKGGKPAATDIQNEITPASPEPAPERKRERGNLSAATKILRRDLGLAPPRRRGEKSVMTTSSGPATNESKPSPAPPSTEAAEHQQALSATPSKEDTSSKVTTPKVLKKPPTEPAATRSASKAPIPPSGPKKATPASPKPPTPQSTGTQAFLKHANPSQGVTEELLDAGFAKFGKVVKVEIDKKKGFGYVDFAEPEGLQKAIQASPVQIAQSQVVVLERRSTVAVAQTRGNQLRNHPPPLIAARPPSSGGAGGVAGGPAPSRGPPQGPRGGGRGGSRHRGGFGRGGRNAPPGLDRPSGAGTSPKQSNPQPPNAPTAKAT